MTTQPDDMPAAFEQAFNTGDIEQILALYESDAVLVPQPGQMVHGRAAIEEGRRGLSRSKCRASSGSGNGPQV